MFKIKIYFITLSALFLIGCVENLIFVQVHPDGQYSMLFRTRGDSTDVFNNDFPHPSGAQWDTQIQKEINDDADIWTMLTKGMISGSYIFTSRSDSLTSLQHPIQVTKEEGYFATRYVLRNVFVGRQVYRKYPAFAQSIQKSDEDSTQWLEEAFFYMASQGLKDLQKDPETTIDENLAERLENHIRNTLARINQKDLFEELEDKQAFIDQMLRPLSKELPIGYGSLLSNSTDIYEEEWKLTSDLHDDQFEYRAIMPGVISSTNADTVILDTLLWTFGLKEFLNDDHIIEASTVVYSTQRIQIAVIIVAVLFLVLLYFTYIRGKK